MPAPKLTPVLTAIVVATAVGVTAWTATRVQSGNSATECRHNADALGKALYLYAGDNDDHLPLAETWTADLTPYTKIEAATLHCPQAKTRYNYALNNAFPGIRLGDIEEGPLVFECDSPTPNPTAGPDRFARHHQGRGIVAPTNGESRFSPKLPETKLANK